MNLMFSAKQDTIAAIATPPGNGGVGIIRISGANALPIFYILANGGGAGGNAPLKPRIATFSKITAGQVYDNAIVIYFPCPHSFTGEDIVELQLHGGMHLLNHFLGHILALGARLATPGEFTRRALLNGKITLSGAENLASLIHAECTAELAAASHSGVLHEKMMEIEHALVEISAQIWAGLDHPEVVTLEWATIKKQIKNFIKTLCDFTADQKTANYIYSGINVVILGEPNVGKSSLFNKILGHDRSIVTEIAGTTTDLVTETVEIMGFKVRLTDTAGIRENPRDKIEKMGIERAMRAAQNCDIALVFNNGGFAVAPEPLRIHVSRDTNIEKLKKEIIEKTVGNPKIASRTFANLRQINELNLAKNALESALCAPDIAAAAADTQTAIFHISNVTGTNAAEAVLDEIFSHFCLGK